MVKKEKIEVKVEEVKQEFSYKTMLMKGLFAAGYTFIGCLLVWLPSGINWTTFVPMVVIPVLVMAQNYIKNSGIIDKVI